MNYSTKRYSIYGKSDSSTRVPKYSVPPIPSYAEREMQLINIYCPKRVFDNSRSTNRIPRPKPLNNKRQQPVNSNVEPLEATEEAPDATSTEEICTSSQLGSTSYYSRSGYITTDERLTIPPKTKSLAYISKLNSSKMDTISAIYGTKSNAYIVRNPTKKSTAKKCTCRLQSTVQTTSELNALSSSVFKSIP